MIKAVQPSVHQYDLTEKKITLLEPVLFYSLFKIADFLINASQKNNKHCNLVFSSYWPGILFAKKIFFTTYNNIICSHLQRKVADLRIKMGQCKMQTADWLRTIVFGVRKQWDYCCHVLIYMVKTIVRSLRFTLTGIKISHLQFSNKIKKLILLFL